MKQRIVFVSLALLLAICVVAPVVVEGNDCVDDCLSEFYRCEVVAIRAPKAPRLEIVVVIEVVAAGRVITEQPNQAQDDESGEDVLQASIL